LNIADELISEIVDIKYKYDNPVPAEKIDYLLELERQLDLAIEVKFD